MTLFLLIAFLIACAFGLIAGWRAHPDKGWALVAVVLLLSSVILVGALVVAAEAGSMAARVLGLLAVLTASAALSGGFVAARRIGGGPDMRS